MENASRMSEQPSSEETERLRALVPLHTLPDQSFSQLVTDARFETLHKGQMLFQQGDTDHANVYLIGGTVVLLSGSSVVERIQAGSDTARFPLAHQLPRKHAARAETESRIVRVDSRLLGDLLSRSRTVDYQVDDIEEASEDDWMSMLLQSRVLQQVPASNIQRVMMSVEQVEVARGDDLIRQGDPGDYYYMLTRGRAVVRRDAGDGKGAVELATLGPGDAFGEEALLSDQPRNSSVTMLQDGHVLRLAKEHFLQLINNPLVARLDRAAAEAKVEAGALWLDLRSTEQYDVSHLPGAINFPFESLRYQAGSLAPDRPYVVYSNTGARAMAGAFLLTERGFDVAVLDGGLQTGGGAEPPHDQPVQLDTPPHATRPDDDPALQMRVDEAEQRARELEERLKLAESDQQAEAAEREKELEAVRDTIDQAKRKLLETEARKREAEAAQQQAYSDMEQLTGNLERLQDERTSLLDRMSEIEGLDKQLQARLAKAERELIGERERAESATASVEELSERLADEVERREQDRRDHAVERGELKEEMTALHLELEQARADLEELQDRLVAQGDAGQTDVDALQRELAEARAARDAALAQQAADSKTAAAVMAAAQEAATVEARRWQAELDRLEAAQAETAQQQAAADAAGRDDLQRQLAQLREAHAQLEQAHATVTAQAQTQAAQSEQLRDELHAAREQLETVQREGAAALEQAGAHNSDLEGRLGERQAELDSTAARLAGAVQALAEARERAEQAGSGQAQLQAQVEALQADAQAERERLEVQQSALQHRLDEQSARAEQATTALAEAREQAANELGAERSELEQLRSEHAGVQQALVSQRDAALVEQQALQTRIRDLEADRGAVERDGQAEIERVRAERDALAAQLGEQAQQAELGLAREREQAASALDALRKQQQEEIDRLNQQLAAHNADVMREQSERDARLAEQDERLVQLQAAREQDAQALDAANARLVELQAELERLHNDATSREQALRDERDTANAALAALQQEFAARNAAQDDAGQAAEQVRAALQSERDALAAQLAELQSGQLQQAEQVEQALLAERAEVERLQTQLREHDAQADADRTAAAAQAAEVERLGAALAGLQGQLEQRDADLAEREQQLARLSEQSDSDEQRHVQRHTELADLAQRLEERELALAAAREEQAELIDALNAASAEREALELKLSDRDDEQGRLVDLENQVAEALRSHQAELLAHEQLQGDLRAQVEAEVGRRRALQEEVERLTELIESDQAGDAQLAALRTDYDRIAADLASRESEVVRLRGVLEEYVDQIRAAQGDGDDDPGEVAALRAELEMVREQAIRDVAHMREQLANAETQRRRLQQADGREAISHESMRQKIDALEAALSERQREISIAEQTRQELEDRLEDANRQLDDAQQAGQQAQRDSEAAQQMRREAETARDQLQQTLAQVQADTAPTDGADLRDDRLQPGGRRPIGIDNLAGGRRRWVAALFGALLAVAALEAASILLGGGELVSLLLGVAGR